VWQRAGPRHRHSGGAGLREREAGFRAVLKERHPRCGLVELIETHNLGESAGALLRDVIARRPAIAGIYVVSTENRSIASALDRLGRSTSTVVITHELTPARKPDKIAASNLMLRLNIARFSLRRFALSLFSWSPEQMIRVSTTI
jgi:hypothetical protein